MSKKATLYVSFSKQGSAYPNDASARYRCIHPAEFLAAKGVTAHVVHIDDIRKISLPSYRQIICHRPSESRKLRKLIKHCKSLGIEAIADFDDQLFCPRHAANSPTVKNDRQSARSARSEAKRFRKALRRFKNVQLSTDELAARCRIEHPRANTEVIYNRLPSYWHSRYAPLAIEQRLENKVIRYFPGTANHSTNFKEIECFFHSWLLQNPEVRLEVIGDIQLTDHPALTDRISLNPRVSFSRLPDLIRSSWITIAPLESNPFNDCKSGLKFWESGIFGVPVIASNNKDMERLRNKGLLLSSNLYDWGHFLNSMKQAEAYQEASKAALLAAQNCFVEIDNQLDIQQIALHTVTNTTKPALPTWRRKLRKLRRDPVQFWRDAAANTKNKKSLTKQ